MKTSLLLILIIMGINSLLAQTALDGTPIVNPPGPALAKFSKYHPQIKNPRWENEGLYYSAEYSDPKTNMGKRIVYDIPGNIIRNETEITSKYYPQCISEYCTKNYPKEDHKIWTCKDNKGKRTYYSKRDTEVVWFDRNGKYVSTTKIQQPEKELISVK